jgi:uncharacterized membrane protein YagU involved in acid resistance
MNGPVHRRSFTFFQASVKEFSIWRTSRKMATQSKPRPLPTIIGGGLLAGVLDGLDAIIYYGLMFGVSAQRIFHFIASGLIGPHASARLGWCGVALGVVLHFSIAIGAATVYYFAALKLPILIHRPVFSGTIFGLGLYLFMYHVVIPLSAVPRDPHAPFSWPNFIDEIFAHIVLVGIPIALMAQRSTRITSSE